MGVFLEKHFFINGLSSCNAWAAYRKQPFPVFFVSFAAGQTGNNELINKVIFFFCSSTPFTQVMLQHQYSNSWLCQLQGLLSAALSVRLINPLHWNCHLMAETQGMPVPYYLYYMLFPLISVKRIRLFSYVLFCRLYRTLTSMPHIHLSWWFLYWQFMQSHWVDDEGFFRAEQVMRKYSGKKSTTS